MKKFLEYPLILIFVGSVMAASIFAPSMLSRYTDSNILDSVRVEPNEALAGGYRYRLTANERLYILSMAISGYTPPQSDYAASLREKIGDESYAFIINYRGPSEEELSQEEAIAACGGELVILRDAGVIPECDYEGSRYDAELYSAVDMLDPQKNVSVWQICYSKDQHLSELKNSLLDAYIDAETGKIYAFSLRNQQLNENFDADRMIGAWCGYLGLDAPEAAAENPLLETTPYHKKYSIPGVGDEKTVVTIGFYEGVNELFLRITE